MVSQQQNIQSQSYFDLLHDISCLNDELNSLYGEIYVIKDMLDNLSTTIESLSLSIDTNWDYK